MSHFLKAVSVVLKAVTIRNSLVFKLDLALIRRLCCAAGLFLLASAYSAAYSAAYFSAYSGPDDHDTHGQNTKSRDQKGHLGDGLRDNTSPQAAPRLPTDLPPLKEDIPLDEGPYLRALNKIESYLSKLDGFKAHFKQYSTTGTSVDGTLYLKRPGYLRFDYEGSAPFLMVADGEIISFIDYEVGQVSRWPIADSPLAILFGAKDKKGGDLRLDIAALGGQIQLNPAGLERHVALRLQDHTKPEQGILTAFFKEIGEELALVSWVVEDAQARTTVVEISNPQNGLALSDDLWAYEDPRGLARRRGKRS